MREKEKSITVHKLVQRGGKAAMFVEGTQCRPTTGGH